jgi:sulfur carrier protein
VTDLALTVNGDAITLPSGTTVAELLVRLDAGPRGVAVAVNEDVVPRSAWGSTALVAGDRVEVLRAAQGG